MSKRIPVIVWSESDLIWTHFIHLPLAIVVDQNRETFSIQDQFILKKGKKENLKASS